jgi:patatin-like phospholipase/acyl hydrolase
MKRILCGDGGGIRGAASNELVVEIEKQIGRPCREIFDMVCGTSTWALIASAVAAGLSGIQIRGIYQNQTKYIFDHPTAEADALALARGYMFESTNIQKVLERELGAAANWTLNQCPIRILITANGVNNHPWFFVRDNPWNARTTGGLSLVECASASAAAPVYFKSFHVNSAVGQMPVGWCYDGGTSTVGNPVYRACLEAFQYDNFDPADTLVISVGTGYCPDTEVNPPEGLLKTIEWTENALLTSPIDEQTQIAMDRWPGKGIQRFNWVTPSVNMADVAAIPAQIALGQKVASTMDWRTILQL